MFRGLRSETLNLDLSTGVTLWWTLITLFLIVVVGEGVLRIESIQTFFPAPSYGSSSSEFGIKLAKLNSFVKQEGSLDCVFLGSSIIDADIDPEVFSFMYQSRLNREIKCFNFGLGGLPPSSASLITKFLVYKYHPKIIFYGVSATEFSKRFNQPEIYSTSWVRYTLGEFSLEGWLYEQSYLYRYTPTMRYFYEIDYRNLFDSFLARISSTGWNCSTAIAQITSQTKGDTADYQIDMESFGGYSDLVDLNSSQIHIVIIEEPVHPIFFPNYIKGGEDSYERLFLNPLARYAESRQVPFLHTQNTLATILPQDGWSDATHLNVHGAKVFSEWLSRQYVGLNP